MSVRTTVVYKEWDLFYKKGQRFKGKLRPSIMDWRRAFGWVRHPRRGWTCPKSPRREFSNDYKFFKDAWWNQEVYLQVLEQYSSDSAAGQFVVVCPTYKIEWDRISKIYNSYRWWFPISILKVEPIQFFPRENWEVTPWETIIDVANIHWRDADMFVKLRGFQVTQWSDTQLDDWFASMTWAWHFLPNPYNPWYDYINWNLTEHPKDDRDD